MVASIEEFQREEGNFRKIRTRNLGEEKFDLVKLVGAKFGPVGSREVVTLDTVKGEALWRSV